MKIRKLTCVVKPVKLPARELPLKYVLDSLVYRGLTLKGKNLLLGSSGKQMGSHKSCLTYDKKKNAKSLTILTVLLKDISMTVEA